MFYNHFWLQFPKLPLAEFFFISCSASAVSEKHITPWSLGASFANNLGKLFFYTAFV